MSSLQKSDESKSLFNKEWHEWFACFLKANRTFALLLLKKRATGSNKFAVFIMYLTVVHSFSQFLPRCNRSPRSLLCRTFLKIHSLLSPFYKRDERNSLFEKNESLFCSFAHKKRAIWPKSKERIPNPVFSLVRGTVLVSIFCPFKTPIINVVKRFSWKRSYCIEKFK